MNMIESCDDELFKVLRESMKRCDELKKELEEARKRIAELDAKIQEMYDEDDRMMPGGFW